MLTPASRSFAISARLCGSSANARTDAATTGPISGDGLQHLERRIEQRGHGPEVSAQASRPPSRRRAGCRARRSGARRSLLRLRSICAATLRPTLPSLRGRARSDRGSRGVTTSSSSVSRVEVIEVGEVLDQPLLEQLVDQRFAKPLDVHRRARGEVLEAAAQPRRARRVRAAPDHFLFVALQLRCRTLGHVVGITQGTARPAGCVRSA